MTKPATKTDQKGTPPKVQIVLGFDEHQKPHGARFADANSKLVAKAAKLMDLKVYEVVSTDVANIAKKLPVGRLYANGRGFVPSIRQQLYSKVIAALAGEPQTIEADDEPMPAIAPGLPKTFDEIAAGHLVIAQESADNGWWEAVVSEVNGEMLTLRFRDFPKLPKFFRHRTAVALMSPGAE